jgi:prophage regulatory protein
MKNATQPTPQQFLRLNGVTKRIGISGSSVWNFVKAGTFPSPIKLSPNCTAWVTAEVDQWAADRIAASRKAAKGQ